MLFVCHRIVNMTALYQLEINCDQDKFGALFRRNRHDKQGGKLEDKHVVNEHYLIRRSYDSTHKKVLTWCILMYHVIGLKQTRGRKNVTQKPAKNSRVSVFTGKSSKSEQTQKRSRKLTTSAS